MKSSHTVSNNLVGIENERDVFRDMQTNAILFANTEDSYRKRRTYLEMNINRINSLEEKIKNLEKQMQEMILLISRGAIRNVL